MRPRGIVWRAAVAAGSIFVWGFATLAHAHPQTSYNVTVPEPNPAGLPPAGIYYWTCQGLTSEWMESNGRAGDGMFANPTGSSEVYGSDTNGSINPSGNAALGLQLHNVCYGTFKPVSMMPDNSGCVVNPDTNIYPTPFDWPPGPDCLNWHHGACLFTYLPWGYFVNGQYHDGSQADCEAAGGAFVAKDTILNGQFSDLTAHIPNQPLTQCFPPCYGTANYDPTTQGCK